MASVTLDLFLPEILPEAPGAPMPMVLNAVRNACFDFCRRTLLWNETQAAQPYTTDTPEYVIAPPTVDVQIVSVLCVGLDDLRTVYPSTLEEVAAARPAWRTAVGVIEGFVQPQLDTVRFVAIPNSDGQFTPTVAYAPTRAATSVDSRLYNLYLEAIKYGALWKLKSMANQPWADQVGASSNQLLFDSAIGDAIIERNRGNSRASLRVEPRAWV